MKYKGNIAETWGIKSKKKLKVPKDKQDEFLLLARKIGYVESKKYIRDILDSLNLPSSDINVLLMDKTFEELADKVIKEFNMLNKDMERQSKQHTAYKRKHKVSARLERKFRNNLLTLYRELKKIGYIV